MDNKETDDDVLVEMEKKMAVIEYRMNEVGSEQHRTRDRLHSLENDRSALRLAIEQMNNLVKNFEPIAQRVAEKTVAAMLEQRAASGRSWRDEAVRFVQLAVALIGIYLVTRP